MKDETLRLALACMFGTFGFLMICVMAAKMCGVL